MRRASSFRERCLQCVRGPRQILRSVVLLTCTVIVVCQIAECVRKMLNLPTTTYTHFEYNDSIMYPAVTVCRDPPYKAEVLQKYGLYGHPRFTSEWLYFPFGTVDLKDFWKEATYDEVDNFMFYGLDSSPGNVIVRNGLHFVRGQCQTLSPRAAVSTALKDTGYSLHLNHSLAGLDGTTSTYPPGYHVYIHQENEPFSEHRANAQMEYLYVNVGEEVEVKITVQQLSVLPGGTHPCVAGNYSSTRCAERARWKEIAESAGCSGPWMQTDAPFCGNYSAMKALIVHSISLTDKLSTACDCPRKCESSLYNAYVVDRNSLTVWNPQTGQWHYKTGMEKYQTLIYIYFNTKTVSFYEETHSYDWSLFLADFGGSLGFLLGLSVLGVISLLGDVYESIVQPLLPASGKRTEQSKAASEASSEAGSKEFEYHSYGEKHFYL